jgi:hypothetical protein
MTLGSCLLAVVLGMTASCSDADFVKPDQVDARVEARWDELSKSFTEKVLANELAIAHLNSMLNNLQKEQEEAYNRLQAMLQDFATKDYADYQAEQARLSAIEAAKALIAEAISQLSGTGEYQDLSGILADIAKLEEADADLGSRMNNIEAFLAKLEEADADLSMRIMAAEAYMRQVESMLDDYYTKAEVDKLLSSIRSETNDQFAKVESEIWALFSNLSEYCKLVDLYDAFQVLTDSITSIDERLKDAIAQTAILEAELKADSVRLTSLEGTTEALSQRLGQLEISNDSLCTEVEKNLMRIVEMRRDLEGIYVEMGQLKTEMLDYYDMNLGRIEELRAFVENVRNEMYALFKDLYSWMDTLVTSVVYQGQEYDYVYARVDGSGNIAFPYAGAFNADYLAGGSCNIQEKAGFIYATVNPSDIDATNLRMTLENSLAGESYYFTPVPEEATPATDLRLTRASSPNGLWKIPVRSIAHTSKNPFNDADETDMLLALKVTSRGDDKSVYSQYAATWEGPRLAEAATTASMLAEGSNYESLQTSAGIRFGSKQSLNDSTLLGRLLLQSGGERVYRKYIECVQVRDIDKRDITDSLRTVINEQNRDFQMVLRTQDDGSDDRVRMTCPDSLMNNYFTLRYYLWNYDGTIVSQDLVVIFSDDETL